MSPWTALPKLHPSQHPNPAFLSAPLASAPTKQLIVSFLAALLGASLYGFHPALGFCFLRDVLPAAISDPCVKTRGVFSNPSIPTPSVPRVVPLYELADCPCTSWSTGPSFLIPTIGNLWPSPRRVERICGSAVEHRILCTTDPLFLLSLGDACRAGRSCVCPTPNLLPSLVSLLSFVFLWTC
jgi:hypothetical protein